jgi:hypothetical protein
MIATAVQETSTCQLEERKVVSVLLVDLVALHHTLT